MKGKPVAKRANFVSPNEKAKSEVIAQLVRIARKARLGYDDFLYVAQQTRRKLGLRRVLKQRRLPQLLTEAELKRFFRAIQDCGDGQHEILLKLLFYTAVRVSELVRIEVGDVDLDACQIFIKRGQGAKDRYILFPASFRLVLKSHRKGTPRHRYRFETRRFGPFTTRRIQQIVPGSREKAGLAQPIHPRLLRHPMLTYLTSQGLSDAQIQLISGHESQKSLQVYQHRSLASVAKAYQDAVQTVGI
ncbi:MAG: tyrosine-type recombinase/integrase [Acidobacteriaceae bacterium]|nr:tyrosine-type recombinase/integrase [Acidobacteriaceae bacterium]